MSNINTSSVNNSLLNINTDSVHNNISNLFQDNIFDKETKNCFQMIGPRGRKTVDFATNVQHLHSKFGKYYDHTYLGGLFTLLNYDLDLTIRQCSHRIVREFIKLFQFNPDTEKVPTNSLSTPSLFLYLDIFTN